jgi:hypothetical protein
MREKPSKAPDVVVFSQTRTVKLWGLLYSVVVSAHPVEPSKLAAAEPSGPEDW